MSVLFAVGFTNYHFLFNVPLALISVFLTLLILVQKGRGGGLMGGLGGMGGQSAFGTKAGDVFTRITIVVAAIWILLSMLSIQVLGVKPLISKEKGAAEATTKDGTKGVGKDTKNKDATKPDDSKQLQRSAAV